MEIFKISYTWYEGEYEETYLGKDVNKKEFEKDIAEARKFAQNLVGKKADKGEYLGKGYEVECLPEYYNQIIWFLINKKGYIDCAIDDSEYYVGDEMEHKIIIERKDEKITRTKI